MHGIINIVTRCLPIVIIKLIKIIILLMIEYPKINEIILIMIRNVMQFIYLFYFSIYF